MLKYLLLLMLTTCASLQTDYALKPYVAEYAKEVADRGLTWKPTTAVFVYDPEMACGGPYAVGCCWRKGGRKQIRIVKGAWEHMEEYSRKSLMFHEQGHCSQYLNHRDTGIMRSFIVYPQDEDHWQDLLDEFFLLTPFE